MPSSLCSDCCPTGRAYSPEHTRGAKTRKVDVTRKPFPIWRTGCCFEQEQQARTTV